MADLQQIKNLPLGEAFRLLGIKGNGNLFHCFRHTDKTPSLSIKQGENFFNCFSCGAKGDIINLYKLYYNIDFKNALNKICEHFNIVQSDIKNIECKNYIIKNEYPKLKEKAPFFMCLYDNYLYDERLGIFQLDDSLTLDIAQKLTMEFVRSERLERNKIIFKEFYEFCNCNGIALEIKEYLINQRCLTEETIYEKKLFSLPDYSKTNEYMKSKFDIEELKGAGLFNEKGNLIFRDSHRLLIPYLENNEIIYIRCRNFDKNGNSTNSELKYFGLRNDDLNNNTTKRFYNLDVFKTFQDYDKIFITEGEFDCMVAEQIGFSSLGILGVSSVPAESEIIKLLEYDIVMITDNDEAGKTVIPKFQKVFEQYDKPISILPLPPDIKDISEYYRKIIQEKQM